MGKWDERPWVYRADPIRIRPAFTKMTGDQGGSSSRAPVDVDGAPVVYFYVTNAKNYKMNGIAMSHMTARQRRIRADIGGGAH